MLQWDAPVLNLAGWLLLAGLILFCGSLYLLALTGARWLGAITPLGGDRVDRGLAGRRLGRVAALVSCSVSSEDKGADAIGRQARREDETVARATVRPSNAAWRSRSGQ